MAQSPTQQFVAFLGSLSKLPPSVNRYTATLNELRDITAPIHVITIAATLPSIIIGYVLFTITLFVSLDILRLRKPYSWSAWVVIDRGLIQPNAINWIAFLAAIYCVISIIELILLQALPSDILGPSTTVPLGVGGTRSIPVALAGVAYYWSMAGSTATMSLHGKEGGWKRPVLVWFINVTGALLGLAYLVLPIVFFSVAAVNLRIFRQGAIAAVWNLRAAEPSYSPSTFNFPTLLALISPIQAVSSNQDAVLAYTKRAWMSYIVITATMIALLIPFWIEHSRVLHRSASQTSVLQGYHGVSSNGSKTSSSSIGSWLNFDKWNQYHVLLAHSFLVLLVCSVNLGMAVMFYILTVNYSTMATGFVVGRFASQFLFCFAYVPPFFCLRMIAARQGTTGRDEPQGNSACTTDSEEPASGATAEAKAPIAVRLDGRGQEKTAVMRHSVEGEAV